MSLMMAKLKQLTRSSMITNDIFTEPEETHPLENNFKRIPTIRNEDNEKIYLDLKKHFQLNNQSPKNVREILQLEDEKAIIELFQPPQSPQDDEAEVDRIAREFNKKVTVFHEKKVFQEHSSPVLNRRSVVSQSPDKNNMLQIEKCLSSQHVNDLNSQRTRDQTQRSPKEYRKFSAVVNSVNSDKRTSKQGKTLDKKKHPIQISTKALNIQDVLQKRLSTYKSEFFMDGSPKQISSARSLLFSANVNSSANRYKHTTIKTQDDINFEMSPQSKQKRRDLDLKTFIKKSITLLKTVSQTRQSTQTQSEGKIHSGDINRFMEQKSSKKQTQQKKKQISENETLILALAKEHKSLLRRSQDYLSKCKHLIQ